MPILNIPREAGDHALLQHTLTGDERALFLKMDSACLQLPEDAELEVYHERVAALGAMSGLTATQSIALWTRATFRLFEPEGLGPRDFESGQREADPLNSGLLETESGQNS